MFVQKVETQRKQENTSGVPHLTPWMCVFSSQKPNLREQEDFGLNTKFS